VSTVDEALGQVDLATVPQILREGAQNLDEHALAHPLLHPAMARLIRRVVRRQRGPRRTRPEHPQNTVKDSARLDTRTTLAVEAPPGRNERLDQRPLFVSEFHSDV